MLPLTISALIVAANWLPVLDLARHLGRLGSLARLSGPTAGQGDHLPRLSVVVPACNEEKGVRTAVTSMLAQDYPDLELILVNDRSTDRTGAIMSELAAAHPDRVRVLHVDALPPGWLGKNHALYMGSRQTSGEWLLFADADVVFDPTCWRRAVAYAERERLDHLTLTPELTVPGFWLRAFVSFFIYAFMVYQTPYRANDPNSRVGIGIGAFNLLRRQAYQAVGTHAALSLRPDDDLRLGMRIKRHGLRQRILSGAPLLQVEWYSSLWEAIRGLEKNTFPGLDYSLFKLGGSVMGLLILLVLPWVAVWLTAGWVRGLLLGAIAGQLAGFLMAGRVERRVTAHYFLVFPVCALFFALTVVRSAALALWQGGIRWRGTLYPLAQLKAQSGLEAGGRQG